MTCPAEYGKLSSYPLFISAEWDEEDQVLAAETSLFYPGTDISVMIFVQKDDETEGWFIHDAGQTAELLETAGVRPDSVPVTACLKTLYAESSLLMDENRNFGIPVLEADDIAPAAAEAASGALMLYASGVFGAGLVPAEDEEPAEEAGE